MKGKKYESREETITGFITSIVLHLTDVSNPLFAIASVSAHLGIHLFKRAISSVKTRWVQKGDLPDAARRPGICRKEIQAFPPL